MAVAQVRKLTVDFNQEFNINSSLDTVLRVDDNKDGTVTVLILSYVRKDEY